MPNAASRHIPVAVRRQLRAEVGFGCPIDGCGNPYLEYHHFDPPWHVEAHHDPSRMIALCATHHAKADAWTVNDLRAIKSDPYMRDDVRGRFEWMRDDVIAVIGGNYYHETPTMVSWQGEPLIWFRRDVAGRLLLNLNMLSASREPRTRLLDNDWIVEGTPADIESPPHGSFLRVAYPNGDDVSIHFREWLDRARLVAAHPQTSALDGAVTYPVVTAEVSMHVGGTDFGFDAKSTRFGGLSMTGCVMSRCGTGLAL